jgi:pimeloyl-ACP methyl ester carboxylesterase
MLQWIKAHQDDSFEEVPPSEVDFAFLAMASYFNFSAFVKEDGSGLFVKDLTDKNSIKKLTEKTVTPRDSALAAKAFFASARYGGVKVLFFTEQNDPKKVVQFAAMVFFLPENDYVIAFRGTDLSIYGWEEDFLLSLGTVPGQDLALDYLTSVVERLPFDAMVTVVGHSKGGNFALYALAKAPEGIQGYVNALYDFDGPGYKEDLYAEEGFKTIAGKVHKLLPVDSLIGVILNTNRQFEVVKARGTNGLSQHSLYLWQIADDGDSFIRLPSLSKSSLAFAQAFKDFAGSLDDEARKKFISQLFSFVYACGIKELTDIRDNFLSVSNKAAKSYLDPKKKSENEFFAQTQTLMRLFIKYRFSRPSENKPQALKDS